jgi:hypothetical protein
MLYNSCSTYSGCSCMLAESTMVRCPSPAVGPGAVEKHNARRHRQGSTGRTRSTGQRLCRFNAGTAVNTVDVCSTRLNSLMCSRRSELCTCWWSPWWPQADRAGSMHAATPHALTHTRYSCKCKRRFCRLTAQNLV